MIYHVLLVEDEPVIRESIKKSIHWDRMPIQLAAEAENGREALAYMQTMPIDIVITDMRMPVCDGSQMLKQMESLHYNCENHCAERVFGFQLYVSGHSRARL